MYKILIIEDHEDLMELIEYNLKKNHLYEIHQAENANDALILLDNLDVDLILLDLMLPGLKGLEFLTIIKNDPARCKVPVIIISALGEDQDVVRGLKLGAEDYLTKPFGMQVLTTKIEKILCKTLPEESNTITYKDINLDQDKFLVFVNKDEIKLTHKEFELLLLFMKKPKKVFHRNQLLNQVWGYNSDIYTRTVDSHISSLRKKLKSKGKLIKSIPKVGYGFDL